MPQEAAGVVSQVPGGTVYVQDAALTLLQDAAVLSRRRLEAEKLQGISHQSKNHFSGGALLCLFRVTWHRPLSLAGKVKPQGHLSPKHTFHGKGCCEMGKLLPSWVPLTSNSAIPLRLSRSTKDWENLAYAVLLQISPQTPCFVCIYSLLVSVLLAGNLL